jgi:dienelactone hydrolase
VVLLGGSGPEDRDGSIGRSKPLKDLAWGLASRGVAVLRFDKVTHAHPDLVRENRAFTVADEYLPDARAAIALLRTHPAVDPARVFVAGHSLGGTVAPRVAAAEPSVAGLILLAGGAQPLQWAAVRQVSYLASLAPASVAAAQPGIDALTAAASRVDSPDLSAETPDAELPFGVPAPYWLDLRGYDPVAVASGLPQPMLILQGGRDYQVTVADDLSRWQAGLGSRADVMVRVYPADNHFFFPGTGPSSPAELAAAQHLDPEVVADVSAWLTGAPG